MVSTQITPGVVPTPTHTVYVYWYIMATDIIKQNLNLILRPRVPNPYFPAPGPTKQAGAFASPWGRPHFRKTHPNRESDHVLLNHVPQPYVWVQQHVPKGTKWRTTELHWQVNYFDSGLGTGSGAVVGGTYHLCQHPGRDSCHCRNCLCPCCCCAGPAGPGCDLLSRGV